MAIGLTRDLRENEEEEIRDSLEIHNRASNLMIGNHSVIEKVARLRLRNWDNGIFRLNVSLDSFFSLGKIGNRKSII